MQSVRDRIDGFGSPIDVYELCGIKGQSVQGDRPSYGIKPDSFETGLLSQGLY